MTDQIGRVLSGRYRLIAPIGSGASALVYLADDTRLRRRVAVKVLHQALAEDEAFLRRFRAEAQAAAGVATAPKLSTAAQKVAELFPDDGTTEAPKEAKQTLESLFGPEVVEKADDAVNPEHVLDAGQSATAEPEPAPPAE